MLSPRSFQCLPYHFGVDLTTYYENICTLLFQRLFLPNIWKFWQLWYSGQRQHRRLGWGLEEVRGSMLQERKTLTLTSGWTVSGVCKLAGSFTGMQNSPTTQRRKQVSRNPFPKKLPRIGTKEATTNLALATIQKTTTPVPQSQIQPGLHTIYMEACGCLLRS